MKRKSNTLESAIRGISKDKDRDLIYRNFGKFVAQFEDHVEVIRIMNYQILESEGFKNEAMFRAIISDYSFHLLLTLFGTLIKQKFKPGEPTSLDEAEYEKLRETNGRKVEYIKRVDLLIEGSKRISEIRNYLVHGQWMEISYKDELADTLPVDFLVYQSKHKKGMAETQHKIIDAQFFKALFEVFEELKARYHEMSEFLSYGDEEVFSNIEVYDRAAKSIQKLKDSATMLNL